MTQFSIHDRPDYEPPEHPDEIRAREEAMAEKRANEERPTPGHLSAYPIWTDDMPINGSAGLSIRDWFAGQVFASSFVNAVGLGQMDPADLREQLEGLASLCYTAADALLDARESGG